MAIKTGTHQLGLQPGAKVSVDSKTAPRAMRCRCGRQAIEMSDGKGGVILQCPNCRRTYSFTKM